jgi:hypothetical protein
MPNLPPSLFGPNGEGLADPRRLTPRDRRNASQTRLNAGHSRRTSLSPEMRALQSAADRALGRAAR